MRTAYNLYRGNSGRMERVGTPSPPPPPRQSPLPPQSGQSAGERQRNGQNQPARKPAETAKQKAGNGGGQNPARRQSPDRIPPDRQRQKQGTPSRQKEKGPDTLRDIRSGLDGILSRLDPGKLETEDLLVLAILWLLYRDSGDKDLLIALAAYLFL